MSGYFILLRDGKSTEYVTAAPMEINRTFVTEPSSSWFLQAERVRFKDISLKEGEDTTKVVCVLLKTPYLDPPWWKTTA